MLGTEPIKHIFFCFSGLLLLLSSVFIAPAIPRAGEKTPPCYPEGYREESVPAPNLEPVSPVKDFRALFTQSERSRSEKKTPPFKPKGHLEKDVSPPKPDAIDSGDPTPGAEDGNFQTQEYVVQEGDWLVKILREKGLMNERNLPELLSLLRRLNSSLHNLDMIQPGEKIVILVKVVPDSGSETKTHRKLRYETYTVKRGDILSRVAIGRHGLSKEQFSREYLRLFAACNPSVIDPNKLKAGQVIKLPHYPQEPIDTAERLPVLQDLEKSPHRVALKPPAAPERLRLPQETPSSRPKTPPIRPQPAKTRPEPAAEDAPPPPKPAPAPLKAASSAWEHANVRPEKGRDATIVITDGLGTVISRMGEEWIQSGEHIIPMKSGGHIKLKGDSYPIIRLQKGITVIVDMHNTLPQKMARVMESTWANYRVVRLSANDDLRSALDKILNALDYAKIYKKGEPLTLGGNIPVNITGDWIVTAPQTGSGKGPGVIVINLMDGRDQGLPLTVKNYLKLIGVEVIEYPPTEEEPGAAGVLSMAQTAEDSAALVKAVLDLRGQPFTAQASIPTYETRNEDFRFTVQADFYLEISGQRHIIDLGGLDSDVVSLLKENGISVLSLGQEKEQVAMASRILEFLNVRFERGPHVFMAKRDDMSRNVKLTLHGITFYDQKGNSVLATALNLPSEIVAFLSQRGYRVLVLTPFGPSRSGSA